jgi:cell division cycle protein 37
MMALIQRYGIPPPISIAKHPDNVRTYAQYTPAKPEPVPIKNAKLDNKPKSKSKSKTTSFEVLNPKASSSQPSAKPADDDDEIHTDDEDDEPLPSLTPSLLAFSRLPLYAYEPSWKFIQVHRDVVVPGAADALLVAAFRAQVKAAEIGRDLEVEATEGKGKGKGKSPKEKEKEEEEKYAKQCVCQSLLLSYCDKLGGDGVRVFFQK